MKTARKLALKLLCLAGLALACGTLANLFLPMRIPWVEDWAHYIEARALKEGLPLAPLEVIRIASMDRSRLLLMRDPPSITATGAFRPPFPSPTIRWRTLLKTSRYS